MSMKSTRVHLHLAGSYAACPSLMLIVGLCLLCLAQQAHAAVVISGNVDPADPTAWTSSTFAYIGKSGYGTLDITDGSDVLGHSGFIGYGTGTGVVKVDGTASTWTNSSTLYVGYGRNGTLDITGGAEVSNQYGYIGWASDSTGKVIVSGAGSTWERSHRLYIGYDGRGTVDIIDGGMFSSYAIHIGGHFGSTGAVTVTGANSTLTRSSQLYVGYKGNGTLDITCGAEVSNQHGYIGRESGSTGKALVDGMGSTWANSGILVVGEGGSGTMNITGGGLVSVARTLIIDHNEGGDSFINMATGGMLALYGDADDSLADFLGLVVGTDAIRYWDDSVSDWADITGAIDGDDYTLSYLTEGDLDGYTILTVTAMPEPGMLTLLATWDLTLLGLYTRRRKR